MFNKYKKYNLPLYFPITFGQNIVSMPIEATINKNGFCIVNIEVITELKETYELSTKVGTKAMIDSGATRCAISSKLVESLNLQKESAVTIRGFENEQTRYTEVKLVIPELSKNMVYPASCVISNNMSETEFDIIIGADYLQHLNFERIGKQNKFILSV